MLAILLVMPMSVPVALRARAQAAAAEQSEEVERSNSDKARTLLNEARANIGKAGVAEDEVKQLELRDDARRMIQTARTLFEAALAEHEAEFRQFPRVIPEGDRIQRREREEAEQKYLRSKLDLVETVYFEAQTFEPGSEQQTQVLERAVDEYRAIHNAHRSQVVGLIARLRQGKCFEEMGMIREALGIFNELLGHPGTSESIQVLQAHALRFRLICLNHPSRRDSRLVIVEGNEWREQADPETETDMSLGILFEIARAQEQLGIDRTLPEVQRNEYLRNALENARLVARRSEELRAQAEALVRRVSAAPGVTTEQ